MQVTLRHRSTLGWDTVRLFHEWYAICGWCNRAAYYASCYSTARAAAPTVAGAPVHVLAQICSNGNCNDNNSNDNNDDDDDNDNDDNNLKKSNNHRLQCRSSGKLTVHGFRFVLLCRVQCFSHQMYNANKQGAQRMYNERHCNS